MVDILELEASEDLPNLIGYQKVNGQMFVFNYDDDCTHEKLTSVVNAMVRDAEIDFDAVDADTVLMEAERLRLGQATTVYRSKLERNERT